MNFNSRFQFLYLHNLQLHLVLQLAFGLVIAVFALLVLAQKFIYVDFLILERKFQVPTHSFELLLQEFMLLLKLAVFVFRNL